MDVTMGNPEKNLAHEKNLAQHEKKYLYINKKR